MGTSKNRKSALENVDFNKSYNLDEASAIIKDNATAKFDESVELAVRLGVDPRQANQMVRGVASLPHGENHLWMNSHNFLMYLWGLSFFSFIYWLS